MNFFDDVDMIRTPPSSDYIMMANGIQVASFTARGWTNAKEIADEIWKYEFPEKYELYVKVKI